MSTWRDRHIVRKIAQFVEKHKDTKIDKAELAKVIADEPPKPQTIAVGDLTQREVQNMFSLTQVRDSEFKSVEPHPLPPDLGMLAWWIVPGNQLTLPRKLAREDRSCARSE